MKRRFVDKRALAVAIFVVLAVIVIFTTLLMPFERLLINISRNALLGFHAIINTTDVSVFDKDRLRVIAKHSDEFQDVFLLSRTVPVGSRIVFGGDVLVGIVEASARVRAITSPFFRIDGVFARSAIPTAFEGKGAGILEARLPRGSDVVVGDDVYVDDSRTLLVGRIARIVDIASDPFITVVVLSPVDITTLMFVDAI